MSKQNWIPAHDHGKNIKINHFADKLPNYKVLLGISNTEATEIENARLTWNWAYEYGLELKDYGKTVTSVKDIVRDGAIPGEGNPPGIPTLTLPAAPATLVFGIIPKMRGLAVRMKAHPAYSTSIGNDMSIIGPETGNPDDPSTWQPHIGGFIAGDLVNILWGFEGHPAEGLELQVDRTMSGNFITIVIDPDPNFIDPTSTIGQPMGAVWTYRGIYRKNGVQVGQWSLPFSIQVGPQPN